MRSDLRTCLPMTTSVLDVLLQEVAQDKDEVWMRSDLRTCLPMTTSPLDVLLQEVAQVKDDV